VSNPAPVDTKGGDAHAAIGTPLPVPPEHTHILLALKAPWLEVAAKPRDQRRQGYPDESIAEWHARLGLATPD
jgi:hypothetical protein